jgi:hypothetical protein
VVGRVSMGQPGLWNGRHIEYRYIGSQVVKEFSFYHFTHEIGKPLHNLPIQQLRP